MNIALQSYPELYMTFIGWQQYANLWGIFVKTGLAYLPFIVILFKHFAEPVTSQETKEATLISQRRMELSLIVVIAVILLAAQPVVPLTPKKVSFTPWCSENTQTVYPGNTGTTYDEIFPMPESVKVPLWWYGVMTISQGMTQAAKRGLSCQPNIRKMQVSLSLAKVEDAPLRQEVQQFFTQCYMPARTLYFKEKSEQGSRLIPQVGSADVDWLGSHIFQRTKGLYDGLYAKQPIKGFSFDQERDWGHAQTGTRPKWGAPNCLDWWQDSSHGLYQKLTNALPKEVTKTWWGSQRQKTKDEVIKTLIQQSELSGYDSLNDAYGMSLTKGFSDVTYGLGIGVGGIGTNTTQTITRESLPIYQALTLMALYAFLGAAIVFSGYRVTTLIVMSTLIFSVTFWGFLWDVVFYVEQLLRQALFTNLQQWYKPQAQLTNLIVSMLYIGLPALWTLILGWVGVKGGQGLGSIIAGLGAPANTGGNAAAGIVTSTINKRL